MDINQDLLISAAISQLSLSGWKSLSNEFKSSISEMIFSNLPNEFIFKLSVSICSIKSIQENVNIDFKFNEISKNCFNFNLRFLNSNHLKFLNSPGEHNSLVSHQSLGQLSNGKIAIGNIPNKLPKANKSKSSNSNNQNSSSKDNIHSIKSKALRPVLHHSSKPIISNNLDSINNVSNKATTSGSTLNLEEIMKNITKELSPLKRKIDDKALTNESNEYIEINMNSLNSSHDISLGDAIQNITNSKPGLEIESFESNSSGSLVPNTSKNNETHSQLAIKSENSPSHVNLPSDTESESHIKLDSEDDEIFTKNKVENLSSSAVNPAKSNNNNPNNLFDSNQSLKSSLEKLLNGYTFDNDKDNDNDPENFLKNHENHDQTESILDQKNLCSQNLGISSNNLSNSILFASSSPIKTEISENVSGNSANAKKLELNSAASATTSLKFEPDFDLSNVNSVSNILSLFNSNSDSKQLSKNAKNSENLNSSLNSNLKTTATTTSFLSPIINLTDSTTSLASLANLNTSLASTSNLNSTSNNNNNNNKNNVHKNSGNSTSLNATTIITSPINSSNSNNNTIVIPIGSNSFSIPNIPSSSSEVKPVLPPPAHGGYSPYPSIKRQKVDDSQLLTTLEAQPDGSQLVRFGAGFILLEPSCVCHKTCLKRSEIGSHKRTKTKPPSFSLRVSILRSFYQKEKRPNGPRTKALTLQYLWLSFVYV